MKMDGKMPLLDGNYRNLIIIENGTCILEFSICAGVSAQIFHWNQIWGEKASAFVSAQWKDVQEKSTFGEI